MPGGRQKYCDWMPWSFSPRTGYSLQSSGPNNGNACNYSGISSDFFRKRKSLDVSTKCNRNLWYSEEDILV